MKNDIILSGVGGQGILSIAAAIGLAAVENDLFLKQSEVHGMSQRGGDVQSHLRLSDKPVSSDLIPYGKADLIISVEPMESLRYLPWLSKMDGWLQIQILLSILPDYPPIDEILKEIKKIKNHIIIDADRIAKETGSARSGNIVILGAASPFIDMPFESLENAIRKLFGRKGDEIVEANLKALKAGRECVSQRCKLHCKINIFIPPVFRAIFNNITLPQNINPNLIFMKHLWFILVLSAFSLFSTAQKADFKAAEKFRADNLTPKYGDLAVNANWIEESDIFWYSFKTSAGKNYYYVNAATKSKQPMFESKYMAAELRKLTHHPYNDLDLPIKDIKFEKKSTTKFTFVVDSTKFFFDITTQKLVIKDTVWKDKKNPMWPTYSSDSTLIAYAKNHNLYLMKTKDKDSVEIQLTTDGERYYSYASNSEDTTKNKKVRANVDWFKNSKKALC